MNLQVDKGPRGVRGGTSGRTRGDRKKQGKKGTRLSSQREVQFQRTHGRKGPEGRPRTYEGWKGGGKKEEEKVRGPGRSRNP